MVRNNEYNRLDSDSYALMLKKHKKVITIDIRNNDEFVNGHIANSKNITLDDLKSDHKSILKIIKDNPVVLIDEYGNSCKSFMNHLKSLGCKHIFVFKGGVTSWIKEDLPLTKGKK